ncbi:MAG: NAD(P)H-dependent oxidoreductase subunit E [Theionarchaea archaeon]|nr:NAD(P)H-dependent oxidoreductase subunit E [Theionarchaea archaeon]MBU7037936.1 NAD(P)H-dependent oxidoreductase subunit E [Theionarchaea archaeon]MBU7041543.1 NAD(P)H-dependent oxidoreductase subunit E [Theionarchaea archaeon]
MKGDHLPQKPSGSISAILKEYEPRRENLLPILHRLQGSTPAHYISEDALRETAAYLRISCAEVYGVASFYSMFSLEPRGKYVIRVCTSPSCSIHYSIITMLEDLLGISPGETTSDNLVTLEPSSCLGVCERAPAMMVDGEVYGDLTREKIREILERISHE